MTESVATTVPGCAALLTGGMWIMGGFAASRFGERRVFDKTSYDLRKINNRGGAGVTYNLRRRTMNDD